MWMLGVGIAPPQRAGTTIPAAAVRSLDILPASGLQAEDGADAANANGWVAKIVLPDTGLSVFDPAKIVLTVTDPGYTSPAASPNATVIRTIRGGAVLRRQYPNEATLLNSASAGERIIYFSLDDFVFKGSTIAAATAEAGFYGVAQHGAISGPVNSSTKAYYKALASWASLQHERRTGDFQPELVVTHLYGMNGRMAAGVRFSATDEAAGATGNIDVTAVALSAEQTQGPPFEVFRPSVSLANMTQGHRCILNAVIYPWLGDATAVLDLAADGVATTGDWSNGNPRTTLRFFCDKTGAYGGAVAVVESGASGGAVQASLAVARTTPFPTWEAAYAALSAWNSINKGHNDVGGADIYGRNVSGSPVTIGLGASLTATAGKTWVNFRADPQNTAAISMGVAVARSLPAYTRIMIPVVQSGTGSFDGSSSFLWRPIALEATTVTCGGTSPIHFRQPAMCYRNTTFTGFASGMSTPFAAGGSGRQQIAQMIGVVCEDSSVNASVRGMFSMLGCRFKRHRFGDASRATNANLDSFDGSHFVSVQFLDVRDGSVSAISANPLETGFHAVNFLVEGTMTSGGGAWKLHGDGDVLLIDNVMVAYSTLPGSDIATASVTRFNHGYTDVVGAAGISKFIAKRFSIFHQANIKTDTFTGSPAGTVINTGRTKNWPIRYGVASWGNVMVRPDAGGGAWTGEHPGRGTTANAGTVAFTDNKAGNGAAGSGAYTLTGQTNLAYDRVPAGFAMCGFDLAGQPRRNDGTGAAGAHERGLSHTAFSGEMTMGNGMLPAGGWRVRAC